MNRTSLALTLPPRPLDRSAPGAPYNCSMCYNATTGTMFWGFATCLIYAGAIVNGTDARLQSLVNQVGRAAVDRRFN